MSIPPKGEHLRHNGCLLYKAEPSIIPHDLFYACPGFEIEKPDGWKWVDRRFIRKRDGRRIGECLVYTDGSCYHNGREDAQGECIVACEPWFSAPEHFDVDKSFMEIAAKETEDLSNYTLDEARRYIRPTSNRAKLYAAILALEARPWAEEGWLTLVVAGDLEYVVSGITDWIWGWRKSGWIRTNGRRVANVDLWEVLLDRILELDMQGVAVKFWKVPRVKSS